jgi:hypothetical protein
LTYKNIKLMVFWCFFFLWIWYSCRTWATSRRSSTHKKCNGGLYIWSMWGDKEFVVS